MVGHYWLRDPERAPDPAITAAIHASWDQIARFAADFHAGTVAATTASKTSRPCRSTGPTRRRP